MRINNRNIFLILFLMLISFSCVKEEDDDEILYISDFRIGDIEFELKNQKEYTALLPQSIDVTALTPSFNSSGAVYVKREKQISGQSTQDFTKSVIYKVVSRNGKKHRYYTVKLSDFTPLPKLYINTQNSQSITSKETYVNAQFILHPNGLYDSEVLNTTGKIRGRGNSTWGMAKKPYRIKFDAPQQVFNLPAHKDWVLLANYADKTLLRTKIAYEISKTLNMAFTPSSQFIEVFLNGTHIGMYQLTDLVEVGKNRVNVETLSPNETDEEKITGGYLLEIDYRSKTEEGAVWFESRGMPIAVKSPKYISTQQLDYISQHIKKADNILYTASYLNEENGYKKYFDIDSFIEWFIVNELLKNCDASGFSSIFFYKKRGDDKLYMGPAWDFDLSMGNARHAPACQITSGWWIKTSPRYSRMFLDQEFKDRVKYIWNQKKSDINRIIESIDLWSEEIEISREKNFILWPNFEDPDYFVIPGNTTYDLQLMYIKTFLEERFEWLDDRLNNL